MTAEELLEQYPPPPPPIFRASSHAPDWSAVTGHSSGEEAWQAITAACGERTDRAAPAVTPSAWAELVDCEVSRRLTRRLRIATRPELQALEQAECRENLLWWVDHWATLMHPKAERSRRYFPALLFPYQRSLLLWVQDLVRRASASGGDVVAAVEKGREIGATSLFCLYFAHELIYEPAFTSRMLALRDEDVDTRERPDTLMGRIRIALDACPSWMVPVRSRQAGRPDTLLDQHGMLRDRLLDSTVTGHATTGEAGRSGRCLVTLVDEAGRMHVNTQGDLQQALATVSAATFYVSSPANAPDTPFEGLARGLPDERVVTLTWRVDPRRDRAWYDGQLVSQGGSLTPARRAVEHECQHGKAPDHAVWPEAGSVEIDDAVDLSKVRLWVGGMDVGTGGAHTAYVRAGLDETTLRPWQYMGRRLTLPRIIVARCLGWQRTASATIADDIAEDWIASGCAGRWSIAVDPASTAPSHDQTTFQEALLMGGPVHGHGLPVESAPPEVDRDEGRSELIAQAGLLMRCGHLIFAPGSELIVRMARAWEHKDGKPTKGEPSHYCEALLYLLHHALSGSLSPSSAPSLSNIFGDEEGWRERVKSRLPRGSLPAGLDDGDFLL